MTIEVPYTNKPEDIPVLLTKLIETEVPTGIVNADYIKSLGFSTGSSKNLFNILKKLGFIDGSDKASTTWTSYATSENRKSILAYSTRDAYSDLFTSIMCPYMEDDEVLLGYLKKFVKATPRDMEFMLETFRQLSEPADFQDLLCEAGPEPLLPVESSEELTSSIKVNPNLQLNIQIHIDPNTPDEKIETIFKNMRKYLMGKE